MKLKVGFSVLLLYISVYYFVPFVFGTLLDFHFLDYLGGNPDYKVAILFVLLFLFIFVLVYTYLPKLSLGTIRIRLNILDSWFFSSTLCLVYMALAIKFNADYGLQFRHQGASISEAASYVKLLLLLRLFINGYLIFLLAKVHASVPLKIHQVCNLFLCALGISLAATSSFDVLALAVILMLLAVPFFNKNYITASLQFNHKSFINLLFLFALFVGVIFIGMANKIGMERAVDFVFEDGLLTVFEIALSRVAIFFYSLSHALNENAFDFYFQMQPLTGNLENLEFRINTLLGGAPERPELGSSGRINSEEIYINPKVRNGAAPGMIGSIFYLPFFPFGMLFSILYIVFITRLLDSIFLEQLSMSFLPTLFLLTVFQTLVDAQADLVNILGLGFLQLIAIYFVWLNRSAYENSIKNEL